MSTRVGTLKPSRGRSVWPAAVVLSTVMLTVAVIAVSMDRADTTPANSSIVEAPVGAVVAGTAANTPSELRGATTAERSGAGISFVRHVPRRGIGGDASEHAPGIGANTPSEVTGGMPKTSPAEIRARELIRRP